MEKLTAAQLTEAEAALSGQSQASASLAAVEAGVGEDRRCPRCGTPGAVSRGRANGLRRCQCKGCKRTFNAATGTPLAGLRHKDRLPGFGACLRAGNTVRESAVRCGIDVTTAFRWRQPLPGRERPGSRKGSRASSRPTKPVFSRVSKEKEAGPQGAARRRSRFRF